MQAKKLLDQKRSTKYLVAAALTVMALWTVASFASAIPAQAEPALQPKTTHDVAGRENCLACHPVGGGAKPSPASHASYSNAMCLGCHPAGAAAPAAPAKPAAEPTKPAAAEPTKPAAPEPTKAAAAEPTKPAAAAPAQATAPAASPTAAPAPTQAAPAPTQAAAVPTQAAAAQPAQAAPAAAVPACIDCHKNKDMSMQLSSGEKLSLYMDQDAMNKSVHNGNLKCVDCHSNITSVPHAKLTAATKRDFTLQMGEACKRCHLAQYTKGVDGNHFKAMESGNKNAPVCSDCHGAHNVSKPATSEATINTTCSSCHNQVFSEFTKSVHGGSLAKGENNTDTPMCTDCHGSHSMKDANSASFRLDSPEMCARCHSDATLMKKYNLSSNVFQTYLQDFHGKTVALTKQQGPNNWTKEAVCTDCHGVHNIMSVKKGNPAEIKQNVVATCQKCHPNASTNFPDAWLSHYEVTPEKAFLPWLVRMWYFGMVPIMVGGLMILIVADLRRTLRRR